MSVRMPLPELTDTNRDFWQGGEHGELRIARCRACRTWFHPPTAVCPECLSFDVGAEAVSGKATVAAYTINYQAWIPGMEVPFVLAIVELDDVPGVRLTTRLLDVKPEDAKTGLRVAVEFEQVDDVWLPLFRSTGVDA